MSKSIQETLAMISGRGLYLCASYRLSVSIDIYVCAPIGHLLTMRGIDEIHPVLRGHGAAYTPLLDILNALLKGVCAHCRHPGHPLGVITEDDILGVHLLLLSFDTDTEGAGGVNFRRAEFFPEKIH